MQKGAKYNQDGTPETLQNEQKSSKLKTGNDIRQIHQTSAKNNPLTPETRAMVREGYKNHKIQEATKSHQNVTQMPPQMLLRSIKKRARKQLRKQMESMTQKTTTNKRFGFPKWKPKSA